MSIEKEDWVIFEGAKYRVIHVYENTGYCEIIDESYRYNHLVECKQLEKLNEAPKQ